MAFIRFLCCCLFPAAMLHAVAVEYRMDKPLELQLGWRFIRGTDFYMQHQCNKESLRIISETISGFLVNQKIRLGPGALREPLQIRLHANQQVYRNRLHFSREREGHYNSNLNILTSHCGVGRATLEQQLYLYIMADVPLREWQKIFIAETLPNPRSGRYFNDVTKTKPATLRFVLLSNHTPGKTERALLARLAAYLANLNKLEDFAVALARDRSFDDTGSEILQQITQETVENLEVKLAPLPPKSKKAASNNTLRNYKK